MRDWIVIATIAAVALGTTLWWWLGQSRGGAPSSNREPEAMPPTPAARSAGGPPRSLAMLEFEGEPGVVDIVRPEVVIGRHSEDDIQVRDVRISRHHARLVAHRDGGFEIHNLTAVRSEPNPMQINGETREHARLKNGDVVSLGGVSFTLWLKAA